jgi:alkylation response protein AidB-like acyl-CoA dehydrogenase
MDFALGTELSALQERCLALARDFAKRAGEHDRDASEPAENYARLRAEGFLELTMPTARGGTGLGFLAHTVAYEALGTGCPSTALSFNMHASVVMPLMESAEVTETAKAHLADLVCRQKLLIAGNYSEATSTALIGERWLDTVARRDGAGWRIDGRKMFASMIEAADHCLIMARPADAATPSAGMLILIPRRAEGRSIVKNWDVLGMRATRSDSLVLEGCPVPDRAVMLNSDDIRRFRRGSFAWGWGSYTAVYLGVAWAAYDELRRVLSARRAPGYSQPLSYHPDARRHIAELSVDLEAAKLVTYKSAWMYDREGVTPDSLAALYKAKYAVGEALSKITRVALNLGGAHAVFKGNRLEQLFRDGALGAIHAPPSDFCLWNIGIHELGLDPADVAPALKPEADVRASVG